jgi:hypothetical protein
MQMKRIVTLFVVLMFTIGIVGLSCAADVKGTVTKIDGTKITVKDEKGKETTVTVKDTAGAKVGDEVEIKGGKVTIIKKKPAAAPGY